MTQRVYSLDWFAGNEMTKYPIDSAASFVPVGYDSVPAGLMGVITDISFSLPNIYVSDQDTCTGIPYLSALSVTEDLITLIICIDKIDNDERIAEPLFAFSSTQRSLYTNRYYDLKSFATGCSGVIVFGESAKTLRGAYKFLATEARFLPSVYNKYPVFPVTSMGIEGQAAYKGNIVFKGTGDIKVAVEEMSLGKVLTVGLDYDSAEDTIYKYNGPCDVRPVSDTCARTSIESIGVAFPNEEGNIDIKGDGIYVYMAEGQLVLSTDYTLDDICVKDKFNDLIGEDYCQVQEEEEEEPDTGCGSSPKSVNFSSEVYPASGEGIEITGQGIQPISGVVQLDIPVLADIQYLSVRVARPEEGGYCKITYGQGQDYILVESERITDSVSRSYSLLNTDTHRLPYRVNVVLDRCNGVKRADGDNSDIFSGNTATSNIAVSIELKDCRLESVRYK